MSSYLTSELAGQAISMAAPSIDNALMYFTKRFAGHLRVSTIVGGEWQTVATHDFGERDAWEHDYEGHATGKEQISQRTGKSTRKVQNMNPALLQPGDTIYFGSVINDAGNIVVAYSGVEAYFDEMFAKWVLAAAEGLIDHELAGQRTGDADRFS